MGSPRFRACGPRLAHNATRYFVLTRDAVREPGLPRRIYRPFESRTSPYNPFTIGSHLEKRDRERKRDIYISKRKKRCFSSLLPRFLSTLLLPSRAHTRTDRKHCFHSFINLAEGNIYRRIHGCIHSRPRFMRPYPFLHTRPHWNWFRPARPMGCASTATGKINTCPLSFPVFFNQGLLFGATRGKAHLMFTRLEHFLINWWINRAMLKRTV